MTKPTVIYLVRHGQSEASITGMDGTDAPLTQKGIEQAKAISEKFAPEKIDKVVASGLKRAQQTAQIIAHPHNIGVDLEPSLREPYYGQLEGVNRKQARQQFQKEFARREELSDQERLEYKIVPDMESDSEALERFDLTLRQLATSNPRRVVIAVCHIPLMKLMLIRLGYATRLQLDG